MGKAVFSFAPRNGLLTNESWKQTPELKALGMKAQTAVW